MTDQTPNHSAPSIKTTTAILPGLAATPLRWNVSFRFFWRKFDDQLGYGFRTAGMLLLVISSVILITGKGWLAILVTFFFLLIVGHILVPATYRLDSDGIERTVFGRRRFKPWSEFESAQTNDLILQLYPKKPFSGGRYRATLCIPLCKDGSTSCEKLQQLIPLRVEYVAPDDDQLILG